MRNVPQSFGIRQVVDTGLCIGCGGCSVISNAKIQINKNKLGIFQANLDGIDNTSLAIASRVCPMSDDSVNESKLASERFPELAEDPKIGRYHKLFAGRLASDEKLIQSSSGGLTSFVLEELFRKKLIDGVIHVGRSNNGSDLFEYSVSNNLKQLQNNRKSHYYSSTFAKSVSSVIGDGKRYAFVGVPCFVKSMRLLIREQPEYAKQFVYFVGLVCGHLKSQFFAESIAWQSGVSPKNLKSIDFRVKQPGEKVSDYNYEIESKDGQTLVVSNSQVMESNWGYAAFQPGACNFCDDVFAETADVTLGDAWLEEYANEWRGTNVAVSRQPLFTEILTVASEAGILELVPIDPETAAQSQSGNFRHRRIALGVRLADSISKGELVPLKRVQPNYKGLSRSRLKLIRQRRVLSKLSLELFRLAKNEDSFEVYSIPMKKEISRYDFYSALDQGLLKTAVYLFERIFGKRISKSLRELRKK